jgi:hypothetical protein
MVDTALDMLRRDALVTRVKGVPGGNRIAWSAKDIATIRGHIMAMTPEKITAPTAVVHKVPAIDLVSIRRKLLESGIVVNRDMQSDDTNFLYIISSPAVDLSNDDIDQAGIDFENYKNNNPAILDSHNSSVPPVAISSPPFLSGGKTMAIAKFPRPGISADSDRRRVDPRRQHRVCAFEMEFHEGSGAANGYFIPRRKNDRIFDVFNSL